MYLLDSCICIDFIRGNMPYAYSLLRKSNPNMFGIPSIVEAELLLGAEKSSKPRRNRLIAETFLEPFNIIPFDSRCSAEYARIRAYLENNGMRIGANDMFIAATAIANNATLATNNTKDFKRIPGLSFESWYEIEFDTYSESTK